MDNKVVITAFSGKNQFSRREISVDDYYDKEHPEFDDSEYIRKHGIDHVEIIMDAYGGHKEYNNYYDDNGRLCRCRSNENGELSEDIIRYDGDRMISEEHISFDKTGASHSEKKIYRN